MCKDWKESNLEAEKGIGEFLHELGIRKGFLTMTQNLDVIKQNINKSNYKKTFNFMGQKKLMHR